MNVETAVRALAGAQWQWTPEGEAKLAGNGDRGFPFKDEAVFCAIWKVASGRLALQLRTSPRSLFALVLQPPKRLFGLLG